MSDPTTTTATTTASEEPSAGGATESPDGPEQDGAAMVRSELLVEEISIDGMCGVY
jgi:mycofactocin precursor